ncbi:MAG: hypothetical protein RBR22_01110 [Desulfuromonas sp.]|nr:hypothetical protein [Desulfuromonas sp.]
MRKSCAQRAVKNSALSIWEEKEVFRNQYQPKSQQDNADKDSTEQSRIFQAIRFLPSCIRKNARHHSISGTTSILLDCTLEMNSTSTTDAKHLSQAPLKKPVMLVVEQQFHGGD